MVETKSSKEAHAFFVVNEHGRLRVIDPSRGIDIDPDDIDGNFVEFDRDDIDPGALVHGIEFGPDGTTEHPLEEGDPDPPAEDELTQLAARRRSLRQRRRLRGWGERRCQRAAEYRARGGQTDGAAGAAIQGQAGKPVGGVDARAGARCRRGAFVAADAADAADALAGEDVLAGRARLGDEEFTERTRRVGSYLLESPPCASTGSGGTLWRPRSVRRPGGRPDRRAARTNRGGPGVAVAAGSRPQASAGPSAGGSGAEPSLASGRRSGISPMRRVRLLLNEVCSGST